MDLDETSREALAAGYDLRVTIAVGNGPEYQNEITAATPTYLSTLGCRVVNSIILDPLLQLALISGRGLMTSSTPGHIILFLGNVHSQDEERLLANTPALAKAIADGIGDYYAGTSDGVAVSAGGPAALTPEQLQGRENIPLQELPATYSLGHVQLAPQASAAFIAMAEALFSEQASLLQAKQGYLDLLGAQECVQHHQDAPIESCGVPGSSLYHFGTEVQLADSTPDDVLTWLAQHAGEYGFASIDKHLSFSALASERASTMASAITPDMYCSLEQAMWESIGQQAHCSIESSSPSSGAASIPGGRS
ncbi:hypothetical protein COY28_06115 [Candidatus Woesearchaeota archaeon CG_4_10_14_0_2_um_filter_57_5]|nr:MAG: hypothetical protein COV94_01965 [Candidatus Woesearchaeota archaeon CG11_big_fil_rev_8_21_14_0_20_57_5]PIZ49693.1 MAG: hypothetical protein COY28_06115 [Candidatus Woesearchaeota archaeon CG_4_10_14_0_2_um_filter_57_5]